MSLRKGTTIISGKGTKGFSPVASVSKVGDTATITITDEDGTTTANVHDSQNRTITALTGTTITLTADTFNSLSINDDTTFTLPTITDGEFHQIMIFATITGTPAITWNTNYFFNNEVPTIEEGQYNFIFEYDGINWYVGVVQKGSVI